MLQSEMIHGLLITHNLLILRRRFRHLACILLFNLIVLCELRSRGLEGEIREKVARKLRIIYLLWRVVGQMISSRVIDIYLLTLVRMRSRQLMDQKSRVARSEKSNGCARRHVCRSCSHASVQ